MLQFCWHLGNVLLKMVKHRYQSEDECQDRNSWSIFANTLYGLAGRMPMAELADSIVQSGRETLEAAIRMVESNPSWDARVVYGDTDSMFVLLAGRYLSLLFLRACSLFLK